LDLNANRSLEFAVVRQGSATLPSPLPSKCNEVSASVRVSAVPMIPTPGTDIRTS
jgi:hypothetical protein